MGAAVSKNVLSLTTDVVASVTTNILLKSKLSTDTSQVISVKNIHGDVHVTGNVFYQRATINMKALMQALSSEASQQQIMVEITQAAKSLASGINLGQFTDAQNLMNLLVQSTTILVTNMQTACKTLFNANQVITIKRVKGNVYIQNNVFDQVQDIIQDCVQKVSTSSSSFQELQEKLKQEASAKSQGISEWILVALLAVFLGVPVAGAVFGGKYILKFLFPIILIAGAVLLVLYFAWTYNDIKVIGYSDGIQKVCQLQPKSTVHIPNSDQTKDTCTQENSCGAYDWISYTTSGGFKPVNPPNALLYQNLPQSCINSLLLSEPDKVPVSKVPTFSADIGVPKTSEETSIGDVYLDESTSFWYQFNDQSTWSKMGTFVKGMTLPEIIDWAPSLPKPSHKFAYYVTYDATNPTTFYIYKYDKDGKWTPHGTVHGPGLVPASPRPNVTGYKYQAKRSWALYGGIAGIVVGIIGSLITFTMKSDAKENKKNADKK